MINEGGMKKGSENIKWGWVRGGEKDVKFCIYAFIISFLSDHPGLYCANTNIPFTSSTTRS